MRKLNDIIKDINEVRTEINKVKDKAYIELTCTSACLRAFIAENQGCIMNERFRKTIKLADECFESLKNLYQRESVLDDEFMAANEEVMNTMFDGDDDKLAFEDF